MGKSIEEYNSLIAQYRNRDIKQCLDKFLYIEGLDNWILDYYQIYDGMDRIYMRQHTRNHFNSEMEGKYPECSLAMKYKFTIYQLITQTEMNPYAERFDVIENTSISKEVKEYIVNQYRKAGYPYGLRIRKIEEKYVIYWDKIHINGLCFSDLGFHYFKEILQNGQEKAEEKVKRLLR